ncbi:hypothetical protein [Phenylobacterium sp.]|uniref:hypothetical protein n=1 Tax=Phenylobacterium sp. TaxID=1871053 RepID=UPI00356301DC
MADPLTVMAGIPIPSTSPLFLAIVGLHILAGLVCVVAGAIAMLCPKGHGRHSDFGTVYFWGLAAVFVSASGLSAMRWAEDHLLFGLGALAFLLGLFGRTALKRRWRAWPRLHIAGMGGSYVVLLTAFYVDNGKILPVWSSLPPLTYWLGPALMGLPIILYAMLRHPIARSGGHSIR